MAEKDAFSKLQKQTINVEGMTVVSFHSAGVGHGHPIVLLHGSSSSARVFEHLLVGKVGLANELIAIDLPGHGESSNALLPSKVYTIEGLAKVVAKTLGALHKTRAVLVGLGLGGHVALHTAVIVPDVGAVMAVNTPLKTGPTAEWAANVFQPDVPVMWQEHLQDSEVQALAGALYSPADAPAWAAAAVRRSDGRVRSTVRASELPDDLEAIRKLGPRLLGLVQGAWDATVNVGYVCALGEMALWRHAVQVIPGGSASLPWTRSAQFARLLCDFVNDAMRHVPERISGLAAGEVCVPDSAPDRRKSVGRKEAPGTIPHLASRFEPHVDGHNEPTYRPATAPDHPALANPFARGRIPAGAVPHPSMRFHLPDPDDGDDCVLEAPQPHKRFSMPGAIVHPGLRFHDVEDVVVGSSRPAHAVDPAVLSHPNYKGRMIPGTVPHPAARFELPPEALTHAPQVSPARGSAFALENPNARGKIVPGTVPHPSSRFEATAETTPAPVRAAVVVTQSPGGRSTFVFG